MSTYTILDVILGKRPHSIGQEANNGARGFRRPPTPEEEQGVVEHPRDHRGTKNPKSERSHSKEGLTWVAESAHGEKPQQMGPDQIEKNSEGAEEGGAILPGMKRYISLLVATKADWKHGAVSELDLPSRTFQDFKQHYTPYISTFVTTVKIPERAENKGRDIKRLHYHFKMRMNALSGQWEGYRDTLVQGCEDQVPELNEEKGREHSPCLSPPLKEAPLACTRVSLVGGGRPFEGRGFSDQPAALLRGGVRNSRWKHAAVCATHEFVEQYWFGRSATGNVNGTGNFTTMLLDVSNG
ncbi:hypothetical protein EI94DRAFT_1784940 [Lactarius quietus]|nr:hypothetical protein EI94DRAFT_1784940 [Lactarius quietus]